MLKTFEQYLVLLAQRNWCVGMMLSQDDVNYEVLPESKL